MTLPADREVCANCATPLAGPYCHQCGQSAEELDRSILSLVGDAIDGFISWDGRFLTTLRHLYAAPGRVATDYIHGRRASYTPPMRLYFIVSVAFFALMTASGLRVVAFDVSADEASGQVSVTMRMWQSGEPSAPLVLDDAKRQAFIDDAARAGTPERLIELALDAVDDPAAIEAQATALASTAQIAMVVWFALLNLLLHPKRRVIDHLVHALYFHAALLPLSAAGILLSVFLPMPLAVFILWSVLIFVGSSWLVWAFDRGFYASSWWGGLLRTQCILLLYVFGLIAVTLGLLALADAW